MNAGSFFLGSVIGTSLYAAFPMSVVLMSDVIGAILASVTLAVVPEKNGTGIFSTYLNFISNNANWFVNKQSYCGKS